MFKAGNVPVPLVEEGERCLLELFHIGFPSSTYSTSTVQVQYKYSTRHTPPPLNVKAPQPSCTFSIRFTKGFLHVFKPHKETHTEL